MPATSQHADRLLSSPLLRYELGRQPANTKLAQTSDVRVVRCRGGNKKFRALRLDTGNFSWGSENTTHKTRILDVNYNASNNELVRPRVRSRRPLSPSNRCRARGRDRGGCLNLEIFLAGARRAPRSSRASRRDHPAR